MNLFPTCILAAFGGAGFALLVTASPLPGWFPFKPFVCKTCLSGWGALLVGLLLTWPAGEGEYSAPLYSEQGLAAVLAWFVLVILAGTGGAHLLLREPSRNMIEMTPPPIGDID